MDLRYERKYRIEGFDWRMIRAEVAIHPAGFRKAYPDRRINNIYFDTIDFKTYFENASGVSERKKYRLRWYGENTEQILHPRWEIKEKVNALGTKHVDVLMDMQVWDYHTIAHDVRAQLGWLQKLVPTLVNTYLRSYFISADGKFRLTLDREQIFYPVLGQRAFGARGLCDDASIVEIKYDANDDTAANSIFKYWPFRLTKNSKYTTGLLILH